MKKWNDDPFTKRAQKENYHARSVYKLKEIDQRFHVFRGVESVLDLGAAPGSWTQYALEKVNKETGRVFAVDLSPIEVKDPRLICVQENIETLDLEKLLQDKKVDLVLSDMAPKTSGVHERDTALSFELAMLALSAAQRFLKPKGNFVVKLFMGEQFKEYETELKRHFSTIQCLRPESTRKHSREIFLVSLSFRS